MSAEPGGLRAANMGPRPAAVKQRIRWPASTSTPSPMAGHDGVVEVGDFVGVTRI